MGKNKSGPPPTPLYLLCPWCGTPLPFSMGVSRHGQLRIDIHATRGTLDIAFEVDPWQDKESSPMIWCLEEDCHFRVEEQGKSLYQLAVEQLKWGVG